MLSYPTADGYRAALTQAAADPRWNAAERRALATITDDAENTGENVGSGRTFRAGRMQFHAHYAAEGVNVGRAK